MPSVIFSETGIDSFGGSKTNGWRSTGMSEETYAAQIIEARNTLWTEPYIRGVCVYCYGSSTDRWVQFDIESAKVLHSALIAANGVSIPTPPPPVVTPPPIIVTPVPDSLARVRALWAERHELEARLMALDAELDDLLAA